MHSSAQPATQPGNGLIPARPQPLIKGSCHYRMSNIILHKRNYSRKIIFSTKRVFFPYFLLLIEYWIFSSSNIPAESQRCSSSIQLTPLKFFSASLTRTQHPIFDFRTRSHISSQSDEDKFSHLTGFARWVSLNKKRDGDTDAVPNTTTKIRTPHLRLPSVASEVYNVTCSCHPGAKMAQIICATFLPTNKSALPHFCKLATTATHLTVKAGSSQSARIVSADQGCCIYACYTLWLYNSCYISEF